MFLCIVLQIARVDFWYRVFKLCDIGEIEQANLMQGQSDKNVFDFIHYRDTKFIPQLRNALSDSFDTPQMPHTTKFKEQLRYHPAKGNFGGYYDICLKNITLSRQDAASVEQLSLCCFFLSWNVNDMYKHCIQII